MGKFRELARVSLPYESFFFFFFFWRDPLRVTRVEQLDMFLVFYLLKQLYNLVAFDNESLLS
jgi:hypothetical protein